VALIGLVLIQERSSGAGGIFGGGGGESSSFQTRRGIEKMVYWGTVVAAILFALLAILNLTGINQ
jgi:protein translocase SecG subunit